MTTWRLITYQDYDGFKNMAIDEAIMKSHSQGQSPPTLRFYGWDPPALSLGYFQKLEKRIDLKACQTQGIDVVRRLTGGRAILHDQELTYSLTIREDLNLLDSSIIKSYRQISQGLVKGLKKLGLAVTLEPRKNGQKSPKGKSAACFDTPSWYEVVIEGKKLIGSAQTRKEDTILQHGSLPLNIDAELIFSLFKISSPQRRQRLIDIFNQKSTALEEHLTEDDELTIERLQDCLVAGLAEHFKVDIQPGSLSAKEENLAEKLSKNKYSQSEWTARR